LLSDLFTQRIRQDNFEFGGKALIGQ